MFYLLPFIPDTGDLMAAQKSVRLGNLDVGHGHPVRVMGVINISPESFYGASIRTEVDQIVARVLEMEQEGADLIDVGAASTAPKQIYGTQSVDEQQEAFRIERAMKHVRDATSLPISVDTTSARTARMALDLGADIVNDVSGLQRDPEMAILIAEKGVPVFIMADCSVPCLSPDAVICSLRTSMATARNSGITTDRIVLDPGIGFGKPPEADLHILKTLRRFKLLGQPLLVGVSRKAFLGAVLEEPNPADRLTGTIAATAIAVVNGADIVRAHDVNEAKKAVKVGEALRPCIMSQSGSTELLCHCNEMDAVVVMEELGVSPVIRKALAKKALVLNMIVHDVDTPAALIIKQEMLALGGDAAYHSDTIDHATEHTDVMIMGNPIQLRKLSTRVTKMEDFGLGKIGKELRELLDVRADTLG